MRFAILLPYMETNKSPIDVVIIGAGPIGLACAIEAQQKGLSHLIIEKGVLVNSIYNYPDKMTFFSTSDKLEIGGIPFISNNPKPTRQEALEYYRRVAVTFNLNIKLYEALDSVTKNDQHFSVTTAKGSYTAKKIIVATGFYDLPNKLNVPGEDLDKVMHYYNDPHPYFRQKLVVVGARNSAIDAALECWRKGADVTMIVREEEISQRVKYWVRPDIVNRIEEGSIKAYFNSEVTQITKDKVLFNTPEGSLEIENDFVLAMTGYKPNYDLVKKLGIAIDAQNMGKPIYNKHSMESNIPGIYLAGVIVGGMETAKWFIENSRVHAQQIVDDILEQGL